LIALNPVTARLQQLDAPCFLIGEIAQTHDGSLGTAHAYIDAIAAAGADAIKFQTHIADAESSPGEPWRVKFSRQDETRHDYWRRMEFTEEQWQGLRDHCAERDIVFLSSAFSFEAVALLERLDMPAWKVGAGEITNLPMLTLMAKTGKPVFLSSGMAAWAEMDAAVNCVRQNAAPVAVFQCTTAYPCPPEKLGLNVLDELRQRYQCPVGLSDHSGTIYAGLAARTLGAQLLEVHVTFSRECFGPDVPASVTTAELKQLVEGVRFIERALHNPVNKDQFAADLSEMKRIFGKSIFTARDLAAGETLVFDDLAFKKPGTGLSADRYEQLLGKRLTRALVANTMISETDFE
jgi:N-acetylneuraminate synthase